MVSTAYTPWDPGCGGLGVIERKLAAYHVPAGWGIAAVDPDVIPLAAACMSLDMDMPSLLTPAEPYGGTALMCVSGPEESPLRDMPRSIGGAGQ